MHLHARANPDTSTKKLSNAVVVSARVNPAWAPSILLVRILGAVTRRSWQGLRTATAFFDEVCLGFVVGAVGGGEDISRGVPVQVLQRIP